MTAPKVGTETRCRYCGIDIVLNDHDGWMPPAWEPSDGTTDPMYCLESDDGDHAPPCAHEHQDYQPAEPDVGIMSESCVCEDCGADLTEEMQEAREEAKAERALARWEAERDG